MQLTSYVLQRVGDFGRGMIDFTNDCDKCYHFVLESPHTDDIFLLLLDLFDEHRKSSLEENNEIQSPQGRDYFERLSNLCLALLLDAIGLLRESSSDCNEQEI